MSGTIIMYTDPDNTNNIWLSCNTNHTNTWAIQMDDCKLAASDLKIFEFLINFEALTGIFEAHSALDCCGENSGV